MANPDSEALVAATVKTITVTPGAGGDADIEVLNVDGAAAIYFTFDGTTPTVGGDGCHVLPAAISSVVRRTHNCTAVKLISSGTPKVCVTVL